jgi:hypothetical protein
MRRARCESRRSEQQRAEYRQKMHHCEIKIARAGDGKGAADDDAYSIFKQLQHDGMVHFDSELFTDNGRCFG